MNNGNSPPEVRLVIVGEERWSTYGVFNANAYPEAVKYAVNSCSTRAAIFLVNVAVVQSEVTKDRLRFTQSLVRQREDLTRALTSRRDLNPVGYYDGLGYLTALYGCFLSLKSFLDVYSQLMAKLACPGVKMTFKKAKIGNLQLSGGTFINWLKGSAPKSFIKATALADLTYEHSKGWITSCVDYRDMLAHYSDIPGMRHMRLRFRTIHPVFDVTEIEEPRMPDGSPVVSYCTGLLERLRAYVSRSVVLLPNVKQELISPGTFLAPRQEASPTKP